jgi:hypothetical protein
MSTPSFRSTANQRKGGTRIMTSLTNIRGLLAGLRALRPERHLSEHEARAVAERQAALLRAKLEASTPVNLDLLTELPRVQLVRDGNLPELVAGSSHWTGTHWLICLNKANPERRQRFTAFHELHHVIEHPFRRFLSNGQAEVIADHFAACVLMPRREVKRAWCSGTQHVAELADVFEVSEQAMQVRLVKLGLVDPSERTCRRSPRIYYRLSTPHLLMLPAVTTGGSK